ncbi:Pumilio domain-containing protein C6G9.14 [Babesia sp. Xinjiang]|uniref:Pumilio domain-containing protein C6G9.14 n=1 Tax=Babesia sp. Xinjiang TaxID=462227 RepID=UPI000A249587|nr:Pumilio domain-containing protein C6G9.14 [Babesia sp. Xinjiang]ORM40662.1 Pumilio domain-containing protein C6G9.14 [Babesia sp. Xinjiang]
MPSSQLSRRIIFTMSNGVNSGTTDFTYLNSTTPIMGDQYYNTGDYNFCKMQRENQQRLSHNSGTDMAYYGQMKNMEYNALIDDFYPRPSEPLNHYDNNNDLFAQTAMRLFDEYDNYDGFVPRYGYGDLCKEPNANKLMPFKFDRLREPMTKQLDVPHIDNTKEIPGDYNFCSLSDMDPETFDRLCLTGLTNAYAAPKCQPTYDMDHMQAYTGYYWLKNTKNHVWNPNGNYQDMTQNSYVGMTNDPNMTEYVRDFGDIYRGVRPDRRRVKNFEESKTPIYTRRQGMYQSKVYNNDGTENNYRSMVKAHHASTSPNWLKDAVLGKTISGNITTICKDQTGCRTLQKLLETNDESLISAVLEGVLENLVELMTDPFGNYLCQKLMTVCGEEQLTQIIDTAGDTLITIALNMHGTRALQKLIEVLRTPEQVVKVTHVLNSGVEELVTDLNGNHVIQKCLASLTAEECEFIHQAMINKCVTFAIQRHGCCVMQRCIDAANERQKKELVEALTSNALLLVEDAYGNYVIQYILKLKDNDVNLRIVRALAPNVTTFAKQKFSSNVVEKCLMIGPARIRNIIIERFVKAPYEVLKDLILHPFGNYVIQRVLSVAQPTDLAEILKKIRPHMDELKTISTGKRIAAKISRKHYNEVYNSTNVGNRNDQLSLDFLKRTTMTAPIKNIHRDDLADELLRVTHREEDGAPNERGDLCKVESTTSTLTTCDSICNSTQMCVNNSEQCAVKSVSSNSPVTVIDTDFSPATSVDSNNAAVNEYLNSGFDAEDQNETNAK